MKNLELILTNQCNNKCVFCHSAFEQNKSGLITNTSKKILQWGRKAGAIGVYFGGGEPTVVRNLVELVTFAKNNGYEHIRILTNGFNLSDKEYLDKLLNAGANEFEVSIKGHDAETHDLLSQSAGAFRKVVSAVKNLIYRDVYLVLAILITKKNYKFLSKMVSDFRQIGVKNFSYWLISLHDVNKKKLSSLLPSLSDVIPYVVETFHFAESYDLHIETCHIPLCFFSEPYRKHVFDVRDLDLLVVSQNGKFKLEQSAYESGMKIEACIRCREKNRCLGLRKDYMEIFGTSEVKEIV